MAGYVTFRSSEMSGNAITHPDLPGFSAAVIDSRIVGHVACHIAPYQTPDKF